MEALHREGRAIGVSNFPPDRVMDLLVFNEVVPAVNQIETHPFNQQVEARAFHTEHGIQHESWGPFAEGQHGIFTNAVLRAVAERHHKTVAQVILRWLTQRGIVAIPKSVVPERIAENVDAFGFQLSPEDLAAIAGLDTKTTSFFDHRDPAMVQALGERRLDL